MKYLFIGAFILAFIAAAVGWYTNRPVEGMGWFGSALNATGVKQRESAYRQQLRDSALIAMDQQRKIFEDLEFRQQLVNENNERLKSISQITEEAISKSTVDVTRLRVLMDDLQNKQKFLVENGKEIARLNQEQLKLRQEILGVSEASVIESHINRDRLNGLTNQMLKLRESNLNQSIAQTQVMRDHIEAIKGHVASIGSSSDMQDQMIKEKISAMSLKIREMMEYNEQQQQRLRERNEQNTLDVSQVKERMASFVESKRQQFDDVNDQMIERKRTLEDRTHDQLEQLKQQREYNKHR